MSAHFCECGKALLETTGRARGYKCREHPFCTTFEYALMWETKSIDLSEWPACPTCKSILEMGVCPLCPPPKKP